MKLNHLMIATLLSGLCLGTAQAAPQNGFSLNTGYISTDSTITYTTPILAGLPASTYNTTGMTFGMDYQFALNEQWSLSPFLMSSIESSNTAGNVTFAHGILGLQLRYWIGDAFVGGHFGKYSELTTFSLLGIAAFGNGAGLVAGWENPNGGFYVMGQYDSANLSDVGADVKISGLRLSIGYRWK